MTRYIMQFVRTNKIQDIVYTRCASGKFNEPEPMHPEDFKALRAWVTAKQSRELLLRKTLHEKPSGVSTHFMG